MIKKILDKLCRKNLRNIDDFHVVIQDAANKNIINLHTKQVIDGALQTSNLKVQDAMVPKSKMIVIDANATFEEYLQQAITSAHSRFPIISNNKVLGIILAKDLLAFVALKSQNFDYKDYLRQATIVPESKNLYSLLKLFQQKQSHMMMVIDEYDESSGLITLEDILEQIVGEIIDEHDFEEEDIIDCGKNRFLVRATTSIDDFNQFFQQKLPTDTESIAGFVNKKFGYIPKQLEEIVVDGIKFKVLKVDSRKIRLLEVKN